MENIRTRQQIEFMQEVNEGPSRRNLKEWLAFLLVVAILAMAVDDWGMVVRNTKEFFWMIVSS